MTSNKCNVEVFARVTGFFSVVDRYNPGKKTEYGERKMYNFNNVSENLKVQKHQNDNDVLRNNSGSRKCD